MQFDSKYTGEQIEDILDGIQGGVVKPEDKNILDRIELGSITLNKGVNDAVPIQKSEILNSKKNGEFFIVGAVINGNSVYLYSYNDGNRIKCFRHYGQDVAIGGFVVMEISNINIEDGTASIDFKTETYPLQQSVLTKTNTTPFTPTGDYHPATKKYVDDNISQETYIIEMNMEYARTLLGYSIAIKNKQGENQQVQYIKQLISQGYDNFIFKDHYSGIEGGGYGKCTAISKSNYTLFFSYSTYIVKINLTNVDDDNYLVDDTVYFKYRLLKYEDDLFDIIKMKNYSLGTDKSQITTYDTVNKAISKLEARIKALEEK